jgi:murein L,D-transpeptidase YcbB/YkuD
VVHQTRVVVGQPDKPTPVFAQQMRFIIVNPYWNVPLSIIKNEMLPKLAADANYFADHGYEMVERNGVRYVRQPPGDDNALGRIKFMFPNSHAVYLHDTNARSYFARDMRALSHGCVRVEQPFSFAEAVLGRENGWTEGRVKRLIGGQERTVNLPKPLPILITYFTAYVDPQSGFQLRDDVYSYAGRVKLALNLQD